METNCEYIPYEQTGFFSKIILDYLQGDEKLQPFYKYSVSVDGIKASINARKDYNTPRSLLVRELQKQYQGIELTASQKDNLQNLLQQNTFTICTAHQPNIFTGHLYFIYKVLQVIKLADHLKHLLPENNFVPVYYMGSEDADLDELGHINLNGEKLEWKTKQTGAVGRMKVDKALIKLIDRMAGELEVLQHGKEVIQLLRTAYKEGTTIQQATLVLVNELFKEFGLLILIPDNAELKRAFNNIVKKELLEQFSHGLVEQTGEQLSKHYKVQASGRELNLFYLIDDKRERIEIEGLRFKVEGLRLFWSKEEMLTEVDAHPERFSANVILRGVFQEMILPNIAFIGGGGEVAYWLELKKVFEECEVPYPILIIRNSFLLIDEAQKERATKLSFSTTDFFKPAEALTNALVKRESNQHLELKDEKLQLGSFYTHLQQLTNSIDPSLSEHAKALQAKALDKIIALEKKMLKAEKRKFQAQQRQINKLKHELFPDNNLQERVDNFSLYYARYGQEWLKVIYNSSLTLEQQFALLTLTWS
jgi:bacillithiol biosynthesis cysteine-adding enzyme BshC